MGRSRSSSGSKSSFASRGAGLQEGGIVVGIKAGTKAGGLGVGVGGLGLGVGIGAGAGVGTVGFRGRELRLRARSEGIVA